MVYFSPLSTMKIESLKKFIEFELEKLIGYWSQWSFNVVGRFLRRPPPLGMIKYIAKRLWLLSSPLMILDGVKVLIKGL